jgi:hypothetical protein
MRWLRIRGSDFIACWAYAERISFDSFQMGIETHAEPMRKRFHPLLSIHRNYFIACLTCEETMFAGWAYMETISSLAEHKRKWFHRLLSKWRNFSDKRGVNFIVVDPFRLRKERLVYGGGDSSTEGKINLQRGRLFYWREDFSTEGDTHFFWWWNKTVESCLLIYFFSRVKSCPTIDNKHYAQLWDRGHRLGDMRRERGDKEQVQYQGTEVGKQRSKGQDQ